MRVLNNGDHLTVVIRIEIFLASGNPVRCLRGIIIVPRSNGTGRLGRRHNIHRRLKLRQLSGGIVEGNGHILGLERIRSLNILEKKLALGCGARNRQRHLVRSIGLLLRKRGLSLAEHQKIAGLSNRHINFMRYAICLGSLIRQLLEGRKRHTLFNA